MKIKILSKINIYLLIFAFIFINSHKLFSYEVIDVCAKYLNTNKGYLVEANIYGGDELNERTNSYNYDFYSTYAVIWWAQGQATVIKITVFVSNHSLRGSYFPVRGHDQQGYPWSVQSCSGYCIC